MVVGDLVLQIFIAALVFALSDENLIDISTLMSGSRRTESMALQLNRSIQRSLELCGNPNGKELRSNLNITQFGGP